MAILAQVRSIAKDHPLWFSGVWFALAALFMVSPLGAMVLVFMGIEALNGQPIGAYVWMIFASVALPLIPASGMGVLVGPRILRPPPRSRVRAAGWGAAAALGALLIWFLLLEGLPKLFAPRTQTAGGGDVPGAALVVGYLVFIPLITVLPLLMGATAGVLLREFAVRSEPTDTPLS